VEAAAKVSYPHFTSAHPSPVNSSKSARVGDEMRDMASVGQQKAGDQRLEGCWINRAWFAIWRHCHNESGTSASMAAAFRRAGMGQE